MDQQQCILRPAHRSQRCWFFTPGWHFVQYVSWRGKSPGATRPLWSCRVRGGSAHDSLSIPCLSHLRESTHLWISYGLTSMERGFKNSLSVTKDPQVKKYAQFAVAGMQLAERKWKKSHRQKQRHFGLAKGEPDTIWSRYPWVRIRRTSASAWEEAGHFWSVLAITD